MANELMTKSEVFVRDDNGDMIVKPEAISAIRSIAVQKKQFDKQFDKLKKMLLDGMEEYGIKKIDTEDLLVTYVEPTERLSIDTKKLWDEYKEIAFDCQKFSPVKSSVKITVR